MANCVNRNMLDKSNRAPHAFYYLGKVLTDGSMDVYCMKNFETLAYKSSTNVGKNCHKKWKTRRDGKNLNNYDKIVDE